MIMDDPTTPVAPAPTDTPEPKTTETVPAVEAAEEVKPA